MNTMELIHAGVSLVSLSLLMAGLYSLKRYLKEYLRGY